MQASENHHLKEFAQPNSSWCFKPSKPKN